MHGFSKSDYLKLDDIQNVKFFADLISVLNIESSIWKYLLDLQRTLKVMLKVMS